MINKYGRCIWFMHSTDQCQERSLCNVTPCLQGGLSAQNMGRGVFTTLRHGRELPG